MRHRKIAKKCTLNEANFMVATSNGSFNKKLYRPKMQKKSEILRSSKDCVMRKYDIYKNVKIKNVNFFELAFLDKPI